MSARIRTSSLALLAVLALAPAARADIWGVKTQEPLSEPPSTLFRFTSDGSVFEVAGIVTLDGVQVVIDGLAVDDAGRLFGYIPGDASGQLVAIDATTAVATAVGSPLSGREIRGAAIDRDGMLVGVDIFAGHLARVDPATGQAVAPDVQLTLDGDPFLPPFGTDLAIATDGRALLSDGSVIYYDVDLATGVLTEWLTDTTAGWDGLALHGAGLAFPADGSDARLVVYDVNAFDDIYTYDLAAPHHRAVLFADIVPDYNAGRGDLASYPDIDVAVDDRDSAPDVPHLAPAWPNPFNPHTNFEFSVTESGPVRLRVFDLRGRLVAAVVDGVIAAGRHQAAWNGRDRSGRDLPSGVYVARLEAGGVVVQERVALVR